MNELTARGTAVCRGCGSAGPGLRPRPRRPAAVQRDGAVPGDPRPDVPPAPARSAAACGLGQIGEYVLPERIFGAEYPYLSSVSTSWVAHAGPYARTMRETARPQPATTSSWRSPATTATCSRSSRPCGMRVLGVEPAGSVADIARAKGVPTSRRSSASRRPGGWSPSTATPPGRGQQRDGPRARTCRTSPPASPHLCDDRTVITVENPSFLTLLQRGPVRHDLPRALLLPHRPRGGPRRRAVRAASWCGSTG